MGASDIDDSLRQEAERLRRYNASGNMFARLEDCFEHEGRPVLALEHVRGKTLREKIRAKEDIRLNWFLTMTRGLQKYEKGGLPPHGDLKPENIIVTPGGSFKLIDPGMYDKERRILVTTPCYNPLLFREEKIDGGNADVFGIGVMLYEILTEVFPFPHSQDTPASEHGKVPWKYAGREQGGEVERLSLQHFLSYAPPKDSNPSTPDDLQEIIHRCLTVPEYDHKGLEHDMVELLMKN